MYFRKYRLRKTCLDKCLTSPVSKHISKDTMTNGSKQCCSLNDSSFTIFIKHSGANYVRKNIF